MSKPTNRILSGPLQQWLDNLPQSVPLRATTTKPVIEGKGLEHWIDQSQLSADSLESAMLWLRVGLIDPTHEIVQEGKSSLASYLHGVVHRLEGDFWNSKYWFRQVRDNRLMQSLSLSMTEKLRTEGLSPFAADVKILKNNVFDPSELVTAVERHFQHACHDSEAANTLERVSWIEWQSLWEYV